MLRPHGAANAPRTHLECHTVKMDTMERWVSEENEVRLRHARLDARLEELAIKQFTGPLA